MITYKKAKTSDFLKIAELDRKAWSHNRNSEFIPDGEHAWRHWVDYAIVYCAKDGRAIVGAILAFPCKTGEYCVHKVFVDNNYRNKGVGAKLFKILLKQMDKLKVCNFLTVDPDNKNALRLYKKWGFKKNNFVKGYYRPHEDRYVLTRSAKSS